MTRLHQPALNRLFPDLREWNDGNDFPADAWVSSFGSVHDALLYSSLFWPDFTEFEGCLVWADSPPENLEQWMLTLNQDRSAVEKLVNHRHITDFFLNSPTAPTPEQVEYLGFLLQDMWRLKLQRDFPHLPIKVEFYWHDREASDDAQITVYLER